ncbi:hypothetical protein ACIO3O_17300 [Streptomyces sp. NPDC087440]|uniref:hypothetical protein n=1 Tax=Streptomyces sp. NPDC087440 TaxID=3365790 RepID=UPI00382F988A
MFETVVGLDVPDEEAGRLAQRGLSWLVAEGIVLPESSYDADGTYEGPVYPRGPAWGARITDDLRYGDTYGDLMVVTGRTVFHVPPEENERPVCPRCSTAVEGTGSEGLFAVVEAWMATGVGDVRCAACGGVSRVPEWRWEHDSFAFSSLGFTFWNAPPLRAGFREELSRVLDIPTCVVRGKL